MIEDIGDDAGTIGRVLALNNANAVALSLLSPERLSLILSQAFYAKRIGDVDAFMLALDEWAHYDSPNYAWVRERFRRFVYMDRLCVAPLMRSTGLGRRLYADLFAAVAATGRDLVLCEVNSEPPNLISDALHATLGFTAIGSARLHDPAKRVRYYVRPLGL